MSIDKFKKSIQTGTNYMIREYGERIEIEGMDFDWLI